jgi:hypothetical protein
VLITKHGEVSDGEYLDPKGNQVITYDHIKQQVTGKRAISGELDSSLESLRGAFEKHAFDYAAQHYPNGTATVYGKDGNIIVCIASSKFNPGNYWYIVSTESYILGTEDGDQRGHTILENLSVISKFVSITMKMETSN